MIDNKNYTLELREHKKNYFLLAISIAALYRSNSPQIVKNSKPFFDMLESFMDKNNIEYKEEDILFKGSGKIYKFKTTEDFVVAKLNMAHMIEDCVDYVLQINLDKYCNENIL